MKISTAVKKVWAPIEFVSSTPKTRAEYELAARLLKKYQRKFGNRHFGQFLRRSIKNGLWETEGDL